MSYKLLNNIDFYDSKETDEKLKALETHVEEDLATEIARAKAVEEHLGNDIAAEKDRAEAVETVLNDKIEKEVERASAVETELETRLNNLDIPEYEETTDNPINLYINKPLYWVGSDTKLEVKLRDEEMQIGRTYKLMVQTPTDFESASFDLPKNYRCAELPVLEAGKLYHLYFVVALDNILICHTDIVDLEDGTLTTALLEPIWAKIKEIEDMLSLDMGGYCYLATKEDGSLYSFFSADGSSWTSTQVCNNVKGYCLMNNGDNYIAFVSSVSGSNYELNSYMSTDGATWLKTVVASGSFSTGNFSVTGCYSESAGYVAVVEHSSCVSIYTSTDGASWTGRADASITDSDTLVKAYPYGSGCVVFASNKTSEKMGVYSFNGTSLSKLTELDFANCVDVKEANGKYLVVVGGVDTTDGTKLLVTSDFTSFTASHITYRNTYGVGVTYNDIDGYVVISATREGAFCYKNADIDKFTWTETAIDSTGKCNALCLMDNGATADYHVLMSSDNGVKQASNDGENWSVSSLEGGKFVTGSGSSSLKHITIMDLVAQVMENTASIKLIPILAKQVQDLQVKLEEEIKRAKESEYDIVNNQLGYNESFTNQTELSIKLGSKNVIDGYDYSNRPMWYVPTVTVKDTNGDTIIPDTKVDYSNPDAPVLKINFNDIQTSGTVYLS